MKATLKLEHIGADSADFLNAMCRQFNQAAPGLGDRFIGRPNPGPWIAEITGCSAQYGIERRFLPSSRDYSDANSKGSRGVYLWFVLKTDKLYQVHARVSWKNTRRYFVAVSEDGEIYELEDEEVDEWLSAL